MDKFGVLWREAFMTLVSNIGIHMERMRKTMRSMSSSQDSNLHTKQEC
jgi:hypothetical protein